MVQSCFENLFLKNLQSYKGLTVQSFLIILLVLIEDMADLSKYSSEKLMKANERQLKSLLAQYKKQHMPLWKLFTFMGYNAIALVGMYHYAVKLRGKRPRPSTLNNSKFTIDRLFSMGSKHSAIMISVYITGLYLVCHNTLSFSLLRKLTEIQSTYHSFGLKFDPNYQQYLLFSRMRKFDLSQGLIQEIKQELNAEKMKLIQSDGLLPETIVKIKQAEELYKNRAKQIN